MENPTGDKLTGENPSPPYFAADDDDDFFWPEISSSGELSNLNTFTITMVSVPTTPESTPTTTTVNNAVTIITTSSDDEKEERENAEDSTSDLNLKMEVYNEINNGGKKKVKGSAMECLVKVLKELYGGNYDNDDDNNKEVDLLETVKSRWITFPRNRGFGNS